MLRTGKVCLGVAAASICMMGSAGAAPIGVGYSVSFIEVSGPGAVGDVAVADGAVFVGVGDQGTAFPPTSEGASVVRIDNAGTGSQTQTTVADGFTSLSGFATDGTSLWVGDNGLEFVDGSVVDPTGDTLYRIDDLDPTSAASARDLELFMEGTFSGAQDVDVLGGRTFITDANAFELYEVTGGSITTLATLPGFAGGLATSGSTLFSGHVEGTFPATFGTIGTLDPITAGTLTEILGTLSGQFDIEVLPDGRLVASSGSEVVLIDLSGPTPVVTTIATGFGFAAGLFAADDGTIYALDGFAAPGEANRIWVLTAIPEPGTALLFGAGVLGLGLVQRRSSVKRTGTEMRP